ncbi:AMP-dependent synthetase/ligase [Penicillium ucsense]|uniref:AMP-dependent synthetase/ligase n=1 Tax=Penicillium ucsense TaxID=2839758 RepID=A0A8J8W1Z6_9EURO|nr:AMP-dependent synthetase/ligase [Penicillium ucsense]KAF7736158.1 AMP-dependent synthetase/ligase [Penicillium ucsense]
MSFPNEPFFRRLVDLANGHSRIIISDGFSGIGITYGELLSRVLQFQQDLQQQLPPATLDNNKVLREPLCVGILATASVEFVVALLAILSIGGIVWSTATADSADSTVEKIAQCNAACVVFSPQQVELMWRIRQRAFYTTEKKTCTLAIRTHVGKQSSSLPFTADHPTHFLPRREAILIFTSGTTGRQKGVLHSREFFNAKVEAEPIGTDSEGLLFARMSSLVVSIRVMVRMLLRGVRIELWPYLYDPDMIWERLRKGGITALDLMPNMWRNMMLAYRQRISQLPPAEQEKYCAGARQLRDVACGGQPMLQDVKLFWQKMLNGRCVTIIYGATEAGNILLRAVGEDSLVEGTIGKPMSGIEVKLSEDGRGELLVKAPTLFLGYLNNPEATRSAFDQEGFFRTGDIVRYNGSEYVFEGRASCDFIATQVGRVCALKVCQALMGLSEVREGQIFGLADSKCVEHVAALVRVRANSTLCQERAPLNLLNLRQKLASCLLEHELPTVLRILADEEEIPHGDSGKLMYQKARERFFPPGYESQPGVEVWESNCAYSWVTTHPA